MEEKEIFAYIYSAAEQREIQSIREKYLPKEATKIEQLRALDNSVTKRGTAVSIVHGILYTLLLGFGMSCTMVWGERLFVPGILLGCVGIVGVCATYPIYNHVVKQDRERIAPEILRLTSELIIGQI